jgi:hypothetical protein
MWFREERVANQPAHARITFDWSIATSKPERDFFTTRDSLPIYAGTKTRPRNPSCTCVFRNSLSQSRLSCRSSSYIKFNMRLRFEMTITAKQFRAAWESMSWSRRRLSANAAVSEKRLQKFEDVASPLSPAI